MGLLKRLFGRKEEKTILTADSAGREIPWELRLATAALLFQAARLNGTLPESEVLMIRSIIQKEFALKSSELEVCIHDAIDKLEAGERVNEIASAIRENFTVEQRLIVLSLVWKVLQSDGALDRIERKAVHLLQFQLGLNEEQLEEARLMAENT